MQELSRSGRNKVRRVPDLLASHVITDHKWIRLNVKAAKIIQQDHVLAELKEHQATKQNDRHVHYSIDACNKLYEQGLLSQKD